MKKKLLLLLAVSLCLAGWVSAKDSQEMKGGKMMGDKMMSSNMPNSSMKDHAMGMMHMSSTKMVSQMFGFYLINRDEIGLTEKQVKSVKDLMEKSMKDLMPLFTDLKTAKQDMMTVMMSDDIDVSKAQDVNKKIGDLQTQINGKNIDTVVQVKKILTKDQLEKARDLMKAQMSMMMGMDD